MISVMELCCVFWGVGTKSLNMIYVIFVLQLLLHIMKHRLRPPLAWQGYYIYVFDNINLRRVNRSKAFFTIVKTLLIRISECFIVLLYWSRDVTRFSAVSWNHELLKGVHLARQCRWQDKPQVLRSPPPSTNPFEERSNHMLAETSKFICIYIR
jgi:hypothetical protein